MSARRANAVLAGALAVMLSLTGCASRLSHARLLADARGVVATQGTGTVSTGVPSSGGAGSNVDGTGSSPAQNGSSTGSLGVGTTQSRGSSGVATASCTQSKAPITIGTVGQQSGIAGAALFAGVKAVQAWVASVNAKGGLHCHPVRYIVADDGGDPSRHQALTKQLVEQNHVIAIVYSDAPFTGQSSVDYLTRKRIPVVGSDGDLWFYTSPMYFPQTIHGELLFKSMYAAASWAGRSKHLNRVSTIACIELSTCAQLNDTAGKYGPEYGLDVVYTSRASVAQPDYTSNCQAARDAGAQFLLIAMDSASDTRIGRSCASVNFHPIYVTEATAVQQSLAQDPNMQGLVLTLGTPPWFDLSKAPVVEYQNALHKYAPGAVAEGVSLVGWVCAKLFEAAAKNISDPPTSTSILNGLWALNHDDLGGLTVPLQFPKNQNAPKIFCYWLAEIKDGRFISPNGSVRTCK